MPHAHPDHPHEHEHATDETPFADLLELDGRVLGEYWTTALDLVAAQAPTDVRRVVDLGAGTGTAAVAFAARWPAAEVIAVDASETLLARLAAKTSRVTGIQADLDADWPITGPFDITWASMSLHHLADPAAALRHVRELTGPDGILAVAEFDAPLRFLPDDVGIGRPGLEQRALDALAEQHRHDLPELGADWPSKLERTGFAVIEHRDLIIDIPAQDADSRRYAELWLGRLLGGPAEHLAADDRAVLQELLDPASPHAVHNRPDLHIRGVRSVTIGRRG